MARARPRGITILGVYYVVVGVGILAGALFAVFVLRPIPDLILRIAANPDVFIGAAAILAVIHWTTAWGLWTLRPWSRMSVVGLSLLGMGAGMLALPLGAISVLMNIATFWYVTSRRVRVAFAKRSPPIR